MNDYAIMSTNCFKNYYDFNDMTISSVIDLTFIRMYLLLNDCCRMLDLNLKQVMMLM